MNYSADLSVVNWLQFSEEKIVGISELRVKDMLPNVFATYTALLPSVGIIKGFPFDQIKLNNPSIEQLNHNAGIWKQYGIYNVHTAPNYVPTQFKDLAVRLDLPYDASLMKRLEWAKRGFVIEWEQTASNLEILLRQLASSVPLLLYVLDYHRWEAVHILPVSEEGVYHVSVDEYINFLRESSFDATLYLFPEDRSWCLVNVEDGDFPILGANLDLALIAAKSPIETLPLVLESCI